MYIHNIPEDSGELDIFAISGTLVFNARINSHDFQVNVSQLTKGMYFMKINGQVIRFIKL